jgi:ribose 5-phosphate isomerase B
MENKKINRVIIGSDHAGYELKDKVRKYLLEKELNFWDIGTHTQESVNYAQIAHKLARLVTEDQNNVGIVICGSGVGVSIASNRRPGVRCALAWNREIAKLSREHNDSNVLALPARFIEPEEALAAIEAFLTTQFEGGRHQVRVDSIELTEQPKP